MTRTINAAGLKIIKDSEGCLLRTYLCPAGVLTIGYGHTGEHVYPGMVITQEQAETLLRDDLASFEATVARLCPVTTDNQFSALVSFVFNLGGESLRSSALRRLHNAGDYEAAQMQFMRWAKAGGKTLPGLFTRRAREAALYARKDGE